VLYFGDLLSKYGDFRRKTILKNLVTLVHFYFSQKMLCVSLTGNFWSPKTENSTPTHQPKKQINN
jgi:hypothetical protein